MEYPLISLFGYSSASNFEWRNVSVTLPFIAPVDVSVTKIQILLFKNLQINEIFPRTAGVLRLLQQTRARCCCVGQHFHRTTFGERATDDQSTDEFINDDQSMDDLVDDDQAIHDGSTDRFDNDHQVFDNDIRSTDDHLMDNSTAR